MYVASRKQMQRIDEILLEKYTIEELVDKASDCLLEEVKDYDSYLIVCGNGNNGADGYSLAIKLKALGKIVTVVTSNSGSNGAIKGDKYMGHYVNSFINNFSKKGFNKSISYFYKMTSNYKTKKYIIDTSIGIGKSLLSGILSNEIFKY